MYKLPIIIGIILLGITQLMAQSPHGELFVMDCAACHNPDGWNINIDTFHFNHNATKFELSGAHKEVDCKSCHGSLIFSDASDECISCHQDMHSQTVGNDCKRCHNSESWVVNNIPELHESNGFPLIGMHNNLSCVECHVSESNLKFNRIGNDCINCHTDDFNATLHPSHLTNNFTKNCIECHDPFTQDWATDKVQHDFFPLKLGHEIQDCKACHKGNTYSDISANCVSCHQSNFAQTISPNHRIAGFTNDCAACHTTDLEWKPAKFVDHDAQFFPIYSGAHKDTWNQCIECHSESNNFSKFTCTSCHTNPQTNEDHQGLNGYVYESSACLSCHPNGLKTEGFDHNSTGFPLLGSHVGIDCKQCHTTGYTNTPNTCAGCHIPDYNASTNPNHVQAQFPTDCKQCHDEAKWSPAPNFDHNDFYPLNGAHAVVKNDCIACHANGYSNTPNTCAGCHLPDYNASTNPNHVRAQFPTDCKQCHDEARWSPASNFDHNTFYPLIGAHAVVKNDCIACHANGYSNTPNTCAGCHLPDYTATTNPNHVQAQFPTDCKQCHDEAKWSPAPNFDHNDFYPLVGAHAVVKNDCIACHTNGYSNTPNTCAGCHLPDYNASTNPNHLQAQFPTDCKQCHDEAKWSPAPNFNHNDFYPLVSAHAVVKNDCIACHANGYSNTPNTCAGCHLPDYNASTNPNHVQAQFPTDCKQCHDEAKWSPAPNFNHNDFYPLIGAHAVVKNDCIACHANGYSNTPNTCAGCHLPDYNASTNPNHVQAQFPTDCKQCHDVAKWSPAANFDHNTFYPLIGAHAVIKNDCIACHANGYSNTPNTCAGCHLPDYNASTNPNHVQAQFPTDCKQCHDEAKWSPAPNFDHNDFYPLVGTHSVIKNDCIACHANGYSNTPNTCAGCHLPDYNASTNPNHVQAQFPTDCKQCHDEAKWSPAPNFNHNDFYPLVGAHTVVKNDCIACHANGYSNTPNTCAGCHLPDYNASTNPNHVQAQFPTDCKQCHDEAKWSPAPNFDHNDFYPLVGAHAAVKNDCIACHANGYSNTPNTCAGCHLPDYNASTNPNHIQAQFPTDCKQCHDEARWSPAANFDHNTFYPLVGAHAVVKNDCIACHANGYSNTPNTCAGCHLPDYNASTNPNHVQAQFPTDCKQCHDEARWSPAANFDHNTFYPLIGAHSVIKNDCIACHANGYSNTPNTCAGCHLPDYNASTNPNHVQAQFPTDCKQCHDEARWSPASNFDHNTFYPLIGAHAVVKNDCVACHANGYSNTPNTCAGCHLPDYNASTNPNHVQAQFPTDCKQCHDEARWSPANNFDHNTFYPLIGAHAVVKNDCVACHANGYSNTPNTCAGCHLPDYNAVTNPNHVQAQFPTDCKQCHDESRWSPSSFNHNSFYPLNGAHAQVANDCVACHANGYSNTPNTCAGCHLPDYNAVTNPNHVQAQFPTDCKQCHDESRWSPSSFNHNSFYPLNGAHAQVANDCVACHANGYSNTPNTCAGCHLQDYNATRNPNHAQAQFPTDCRECHDESRWSPSSFDHDGLYFPIYSGTHRGEWNTCADCHTNPANYAVFTCINCHEHNNKAEVDKDHRGEQGYQYTPTSCYGCHPDGRD